VRPCGPVPFVRTCNTNLFIVNTKRFDISAFRRARSCINIRHVFHIINAKYNYTFNLIPHITSHVPTSKVYIFLFTFVKAWHIDTVNTDSADFGQTSLVVTEIIIPLFHVWKEGVCVCDQWKGFFHGWKAVQMEMHDEIFQFEIFKNFMKILKYFKTLF